MIHNKYLQLVLFSLVLSLFSCRTETSSSASTQVGEVPQLIKTRLRAEPDALFPFNTSKSWSLEIVRQVFQYVSYFDLESLAVDPILATTRPKITPITTGENAGGLKLEYEILAEAMWDNGTPVTARDYEFTLKTIFNPEAKGLLKYYAQELSLISKLELDPNNPKKFTVYTNRPHIKTEENIGVFMIPQYNYDPTDLMTGYDLNDILDPEKVKTLDKENMIAFGEQIVSPEYARDPSKISGSGPYKIVEWIEGERIVLEKKKDWWGDKLSKTRKNLEAFPKSLSYAFVRDNNATITMLKNGDLDVAGVIEANSFNEMKDDPQYKDEFEFILGPAQAVNYLGINNSNPKLANPKVRQAISYLIDRPAICQSVYAGYADPIYSEIPKSFEYFKEYPTPFNLEKGSSMLEAEGWVDNDGNGIREKTLNGKKVELTLDIITTPNNVISEAIVRIMIETFKKAGVEITHTKKEAREYIGARNRGEYELWAGAIGIPPGIYDPTAYWKTSSATNYFKSGSAEMDEIIDNIITNQDDSKFSELYAKFQKLQSEMQPVVFLVHSKNRIIVRKGYDKKLISLLSPTYQLKHFR